MAAGSLTIKGVSYELKATSSTKNKERFYTKSEALDGTLVLNESGNTAKTRWTYSGRTTKTVLDALETALNSGLTGSFVDHSGTSYTTCLFELTRGTVSGNYTIEEWSMDVSEV